MAERRFITKAIGNAEYHVYTVMSGVRVNEKIKGKKC